MNKIAYVAELDQDVDDIIAIEYLFDKGVLDYVVLDPFPEEKIGRERMQIICDMGITVKRKIQPHTDIVFIGGPLTEVARYIQAGNSLSLIVMNGGFIGSNIVPKEKQLKKFKNKETVRTFNFNKDVYAADYVLKTSKDRINKIILVGKNVCHNKINTGNGLWNEEYYHNLFKKYNTHDYKLQHDMLACHEGLAFLNNTEHYCKFINVYPYNNGLNDNMTNWGSKLEPTEYREILAAVDYIEEINNV